MDIDKERATCAERLGREPSDQELVVYLQHPNDAVEFYKFVDKYGHAHVLPPAIFFRKGGFELGENLTFTDHLANCTRSI